MISQSKPKYKKTFTPEQKEQYKRKKFSKFLIARLFTANYN